MKKFPWKTKHWESILEILKGSVEGYHDIDNMLENIAKLTEHPRRQGIFGDTMFNYHSSKRKHAMRQEHILGNLLVFIRKIILGYEKFFPPNFLKNPKKVLDSTTIVLTRPQVAFFIACGFFGLVEELPILSFVENCNLFALDCLYCYFDRLARTLPTGDIIIKRPQKVALATNQEGDLEFPELPGCASSAVDRVMSSARIRMVYCFGADRKKLFEEARNDIYADILTRPETLILFLFEDYWQMGLMGAEKMVREHIEGTIVRFKEQCKESNPRASDGTLVRSIVMCKIEELALNLEYMEPTEIFEKRIKRIIGVLQGMAPPHEGIEVFSGFGGGNLQLNFLALYFACSLLGHQLVFMPNHTWGEIAEETFLGFQKRHDAFCKKINKEQITIDDIYKEFLKIKKDIQRDVDNNYGDYVRDKVINFDYLGTLLQNEPRVVST